MQRQARLPEFFDQIGKNTLFWDLVQFLTTTDPPPQLLQTGLQFEYVED